jgi:hypothetical protein
VTEENRQHTAEVDGRQESQPEVSVGYDSYRSLADSNFIIVVPKNTVPPFRLKAGGWELLQASIDLDSAAIARVAEEGFFIATANPMRSGEAIPSDHDEPARPSPEVEFAIDMDSAAKAPVAEKLFPINTANQISSGDPSPSDDERPANHFLEVEFALVIARMIDSVRNSPEDIRQLIYDLARYKLREQLLNANAEERLPAQQALEVAIRGVEAFSEKHAQILPPKHQPQLNVPTTGSTDQEWAPQAASSRHLEVVPHVGPSLRLNSKRNADGSVNKSNLWSHLRTATLIVILVAILVAIRQREGLQYLTHNLPKLDWKTAIVERSPPSQASTPVVSGPPPAKSTALRPTDYGVYAISKDALFDLSLLPGRPPDIRIAVSSPLTTPSRTILPNGHPKFMVFSRDLASITTDRPEVRIVAKVVREFSANASGKKLADDVWVMRNISFPLRSSAVNDNPGMIELHSEDPALELTPGRYALVLKTQAYDFSVEGDVVDPRQCIERIVGSNGTFYSDCKNQSP